MMNPTGSHDDRLLRRSRRTLDAARRLKAGAEPRQVLVAIAEIKGQLALLRKRLARVGAESDASARRCSANSAYRRSYALRSP
jgi:uncharacterized small protein (DUF1192 family)